jgi:hypothetical protein
MFARNDEHLMETALINDSGSASDVWKDMLREQQKHIETNCKDE